MVCFFSLIWYKDVVRWRVTPYPLCDQDSFVFIFMLLDVELYLMYRSVCPECGISFGSKVSLSDHMALKHCPESMMYQREVPGCYKVFTNAIEESSRCKLYKVFEIKMCNYRALIKLATVLQKQLLPYSAHELTVTVRGQSCYRTPA